MKTPTNISRPKGTNRYQFSIEINGKRINKSFSFSEYGGNDEALAVAIKYKQKIYEEHGLSEKGRGSGSVAGVSRTSSLRAGIERAYWQAIWIGKNGKQHTRRISITTHGERKAMGGVTSTHFTKMTVRGDLHNLQF